MSPSHGHVARPTGALPRRLRHAARSPHDLPAHTHDLSRRNPPRAKPRSRNHTQATQPPKRAHLLPAPHIQPHPAAVTQPDQHAAAVATVHQSTPDHKPKAERDPPGAPPAAAPGHVAPTSPTPPTLPSHEDLHVAHFRAVQGSSSAPAGCPHHAHPPFPRKRPPTRSLRPP